METGRAKAPMSQINVTPFVDVMLVLLIIFMVTTPMLQEGIDVDLPEVEASNISASDDPVVVTIDRRKRVFINDAPVKWSDLRAKLAAIRKIDSNKAVLLRADEQVPYGGGMQAMR